MPRSTLDDSDRELIKGRNFCHVATLNQDGSVHSTLVWADLDGDHVVLNSAQGRRWPENVKRDGKATLLIANSANPYEYVRIEGRLDEERESTFGKWPTRWTARDSLVHAISHTAEHVGHAQLTRDLYNARRV